MSNSISQAIKQAMKQALDKKGLQALPPEKAATGKNRQPQSNNQPSPTEESMKEKFHNPYHFVPVSDAADKRGQWLAKKTFINPEKDLGHQSHARYATGKGIYHGRILCTLTTETPTFIGAGRTEGTDNAPGVVQPFTLAGQPAIPASSLRGLISSVAEAASNSALRVLTREFPPKGKKQYRGENVFDFFSPLKKPDKEMLPMHPHRTQISPAEMIFGFVETREQETESSDQALAYAGRVRFSHALFEPKNDEERRTPFLPAVTLKILDKPKPPCPALYFTQRNPNPGPTYIPKQALNSKDHKPQGRKFYLHHRQEEIEKTCWKTHYDEAFFNENITLPKKELQEAKLKKGRFKQKVVIRPILEQRTFCFHVDFDNLDAYELGMLLYALQPTPKFRHKIGMGKPLGLGSVHIEPVAVYSLDRQQRYLEQDIFTNSRYTIILPWNTPDSQTEAEKKERSRWDLKEIKETFEMTMLPEIKFALEAIGDPANVRHRVHTPLRRLQTGDKEELETYRWFAGNDEKNNHQRQCLFPIKEKFVKKNGLPTLWRN